MKLILLIAVASLLLAQTKPLPKGSVQRIKVHGKSLEGNFEGDSPDRDVSIYLPPGYEANRNQRYPVVYLLHGYLLTDQYWTGAPVSVPGIPDLNAPSVDVPAAIDRLIVRSEAKPMIIVMPNAYTAHGGSTYASSLTVGDCESFIAEDLVAYIETHYRTIPDRLSRGLAGHSMGGYGTVRIAVKRPDVFSSFDMISACCLIFNPAPSPAANGKQLKQATGGPAVPFNVAQAAAFSPNPKNPPNFFDNPLQNGHEQPLVIAKWHAASPLAMFDQYVANLKKYRAIAIEIGLQDQYASVDQNKQLDQAMTTFGVTHNFETYQGDHMNKIPDRMEANVLPFFSRNLVSRK